MNVPGDLIFDVGVCNGDDSAYYLHKGYRVVGVEANPLMIELVARRFESEIREGRYHLERVAIAKVEGEAEFWVCDDVPEWSSFDPRIASRRGSRHHKVQVATCRFESLLERFGTPFYCKIDIEGSDNLCLEGMKGRQTPRFVSIESISGVPQIEQLSELGYSRFKIISQRTLRQPSRSMALLLGRIPSLASWALAGAEARLARHRRDGAWTFPRGSSGPFGEGTIGEWLDMREAIELNRITQLGAGWYWCDIHATFDESPPRPD